jgi:uncharacterized protein (DUF433 family)
MVNSLEHDFERLARPLYTYAEADRLAGVPRGTSSRWVKGYQYWSEFGERIAQPSITAGPADRTQPGVSFFDLIGIKGIAGLKLMGFSLPRIREVVRYCQDQLGVAYPLATETFKTDRNRIYMTAGDGRLLEVLGGQRGAQAWDAVLNPFLGTLDYHNDFARRWWPLGRDDPVIVDPDYGFGSPVIVGSGLRTELVGERREVGDPPEIIAYDFSLTPEQVASALKMEDKLAA